MRNIMIFLMANILLLSCTNKWNDYYTEDTTPITGEGTQKLDMSTVEFLESSSEYSKYLNLIKAVGLDKELKGNQSLTIWVADNSVVEASGVTNLDTLTMKCHINNLSFRKSELKDGLRITSLSGIGFSISKTDDGILANESKIIKAYELTNGMIYIIDKMMIPQISMYEYLFDLPDEYSMIRDSIFRYNKLEFQRGSSKPIGVDATGNTIYDSVFKVTNPIFDKADFANQSKMYTVLVPNNEVIDACILKMQNQYEKMGKVFAKADTLLAMQWIKEAIFYSGESAFDDESLLDVNSVYKRVWRTSVQKFNRANPRKLSNGIAYEITELKIPNNFFISRIKSLVNYWQYLSEDEKYSLYDVKGLKSGADVVISTRDATPWPEKLPNYITFEITGDATLPNELSVEFAPIDIYIEDGVIKAKQLFVPIGEYDLYAGFLASGHPRVDFSINGRVVATNVDVSSSSPWNYDRVTETAPSPAPGKWDGLGGKVGTLMVIGEEGENLASFKLKVKYNQGTNKILKLYHWALKPTANNY